MKPNLSMSKAWVLLGVFAGLCLGGFSKAEATVAAQALDASGFREYALISDLSKGGAFNVNQTTVKGNVGVIGSTGATAANNDHFYGNLGYTGSSFTLNSTVAVSGVKAQDLSLSTAMQQAALFAKTMANFTPTQILTGDRSNASVSGNGGINVVNFTGVNVNGIVTLNGGANDVFYINVSSNLNISGIVLNGVSAGNVYWNLINGQSSNLTGSLYGTFLSFTSGNEAGTVNINNATVEGGIYGGTFNMNNVNVSGLPLAEAPDPNAMAPEVNSYVAMLLFGAFLFGSSWLRAWKRRHQAAGMPSHASV